MFLITYLISRDSFGVKFEAWIGIVARTGHPTCCERLWHRALAVRTAICVFRTSADSPLSQVVCWLC